MPKFHFVKSKTQSAKICTWTQMKTAKLCRNYNWLTMNWVKKTFTLHSTFILNVKRIKWNNPLTSLKCALQMMLNCVNYFCTHEIYCSSVTGPHELDHTYVMWYGGCVYGRSFCMWRLYPTRITTRYLLCFDIWDFFCRTTNTVWSLNGEQVLERA